MGRPLPNIVKNLSDERNLVPEYPHDLPGPVPGRSRTWALPYLGAPVPGRSRPVPGSGKKNTSSLLRQMMLDWLENLYASYCVYEELVYKFLEFLLANSAFNLGTAVQKNWNIITKNIKRCRKILKFCMKVVVTYSYLHTNFRGDRSSFHKDIALRRIAPVEWVANWH